MSWGDGAPGEAGQGWRRPRSALFVPGILLPVVCGCHTLGPPFPLLWRCQETPWPGRPGRCRGRLGSLACPALSWPRGAQVAGVPCQWLLGAERAWPGWQTAQVGVWPWAPTVVLCRAWGCGVFEAASDGPLGDEVRLTASVRVLPGPRPSSKSPLDASVIPFELHRSFYFIKKYSFPPARGRIYTVQFQSLGGRLQSPHPQVCGSDSVSRGPSSVSSCLSSSGSRATPRGHAPPTLCAHPCELHPPTFLAVVLSQKGNLPLAKALE